MTPKAEEAFERLVDLDEVFEIAARDILQRETIEAVFIAGMRHAVEICRAQRTPSGKNPRIAKQCADAILKATE